MKLKTILLTLLLSFGLSGVAYADAGLDAALKGCEKDPICRRMYPNNLRGR